jgi:hypothetical protein
MSGVAKLAELPRVELPPDLREILVEALAHALVAEYRRRHGQGDNPGRPGQGAEGAVIERHHARH